MKTKNLQTKQVKTAKKEKIVLPTGEYVGKLEDSWTELSKSKDLILIFCWIIQNGEYKGSKYYTYFNLRKEKSLQVMLRMLSYLGFFDLGSFEGLPALYGHECRFKVKQIHHKVYGKSNIIERYLPSSDFVGKEITFVDLGEESVFFPYTLVS